MMGELSHELKNLNNASILGMAVEQDRGGNPLVFLRIRPPLDRFGTGIVRARSCQWRSESTIGPLAEFELVHRETAGVFEEVRSFMSDLAIDDALLDELMENLSVLSWHKWFC